MSSDDRRPPDIPLLDEVTNLLEKERTLMGLKVLEQQVEAQDWKRKYEALLGQVADNSSRTDSARVFEIAADIAAKPVRVDNFRVKIMETLRAGGVNWVVDLSNITVGGDGMTEVLKIFHGMRDSCRVTVILLRSCDLDSSCNEHVAAVVSFPYFEGIDISCNNLTRPFYESMLKALEVRRRAPQYLILNNNPELISLSFTKMLQTLSQETWGLVVTVQDAASSSTKSAGTSSSKSKTAMCAADFLKVLNTQLVGNKKKSKGADNYGKTKTGVQLLSVLGLVNSTLSRISLKMLEDTLDLAIASLTDLDLSFSFVGYRGLELIKSSIVQRGKSQLVRLGLKGNAFTNSMVPLLGNILQHSVTLTYLDISNNMITGDGLLDLTNLMTNNFILSTLCLTGNPIGQNSATLAQDLLTKCGCPVKLRWNGILSPTGLPSIQKSHKKKHAFIFSRLKKETTLVQPSGSDAVIYTVPVGCIQVKQSISYSKDATARPGTRIKDAVRATKMLVEWSMRPRFEDAAALADLDKANHRRHVNTVFIPLEWEICLVTPQGRATLAKEALGAGAGLPSGDTWVQCRAVVDAVPTHGQLEIVLRAVKSITLVGDPNNPLYARQADVRMRSNQDLLSKSAAFRNSTSVLPAIHVDTYGLNFSAYDDVSTEDAVFGEDIMQWSGTLNQMVSLRSAALLSFPTFSPAYEVSDSLSTIRAAGGYMKDTAGFPPAGHNVLRMLHWPGPISIASSIEFETKLSGRVHVSTSGIEADWDVPSNDSEGGQVQMSYETAVHICFSHGQYETIGSCSLLPSGKCVGSDNFMFAGDTASSSVSPGLATWLWRQWKVSLPMIRPGDRIIVTGRVIKNSNDKAYNPAGGSLESSAAKCFIHCRSASIAVPYDCFEGREELVGADPSVLFAVHNDPSLFPC